MTYPRTYKSIKKFVVSQAFMLVSEAMMICLLFFSITLYRANISIEDINSPLVLVTYGVMLAYMAVRIGSYVVCIIGLHKASKDDVNFKIAFYSSVITSVIAVGSLVGVFNKEITSISELLILLTVMLTEIYILEGLRSLCLQLGHPEMDKTGAVVYAVIVTVFVIRTCVCIISLVLDSNAATANAAMTKVPMES